MPKTLYAALILTFGLVLAGSSFHAYNAYASLIGSAQSIRHVPTPYFTATALIVVRALVSAIAIGALLVAKTVRAVRLVSACAILVLIVLGLLNAPLIYKLVSVYGFSALSGVTPLVLGVVWLVFLFVAVTSNYAFKRTAGRGVSVS